MNPAQRISIDFTSLAGEEILEALEREFQYQMNLSDGCYFFWHDESFLGWSLLPAIETESQAILQFLAECSCPISLHRLGCSLSPRNMEHGPITSDSLAVKYLLQGFETLANLNYDPKIKRVLDLYRSTQDYRQACEMLATYWGDIEKNNICSEVFDAISDFTTPDETH